MSLPCNADHQVPDQYTLWHSYHVSNTNQLVLFIASCSGLLQVRHIWSGVGQGQRGDAAAGGGALLCAADTEGGAKELCAGMASRDGPQ